MAPTPDRPTEKFACLVRARAHPGRGDELVQGYASVFAQVDEEKATEVFILSRSVDDPDQFFCFEIFSSRADFDAHRAHALSGDTLDALNAATAEREFVWGVPVWSKG
jgi:quinol monooxygenase YgiN